MKTRLGILFQTVINQPFKRRRDILVCIRKIWWVLFQNRAHRVGSRLAVKGATAGKHLVENCAERENIGTMIYGLPAHLLWRHIAHSSHDDSRTRVDTSGRNVCLRSSASSLREICNSKIKDF